MLSRLKSFFSKKKPVPDIQKLKYQDKYDMPLTNEIVLVYAASHWSSVLKDDKSSKEDVERATKKFDEYAILCQLFIQNGTLQIISPYVEYYGEIYCVGLPNIIGSYRLH